MITIKSIIIILFSFVLLSAKGPLTKTDIREFKKEIATAPGKTLYVFDTQADLNFSTAATETISVKAKIELGDIRNNMKESFFERTSLDIKPYKEG